MILDLPAAWRMALQVCPYCSGTGERESEDGCGFCAGTGDLLGHVLERAYAMGRDEAVVAMRALYSDWLRAGRVARETAPGALQLRARLGL